MGTTGAELSLEAILRTEPKGFPTFKIQVRLNTCFSIFTAVCNSGGGVCKGLVSYIFTFCMRIRGVFLEQRRIAL